jgi:uroporphyrin-III C-methyltransferase / precorrin-2 dehydrogenase / sirohydrochlorin ferrochelatase
MHSLPIFVRLAGVPVILLGDGDAANAKRRLLERAGARVVADDPAARLAIVALADDDEARAAVARLRARGLLVNAVDRPELCDWTLPAIVDRDPVIVAIGTGGVSAGLAAALRQRLEALLPSRLGSLATELRTLREAMAQRWPDPDDRRRALAAALGADAPLDPLGGLGSDVRSALLGESVPNAEAKVRIRLRSSDPDDLTLRDARLLARADRVTHGPDVPPAILARARADAPRIECRAPFVEPGPGLTVDVRMT